MELKNDLLLRAARGEKVERTPIWLMRQAGRILPEYRAVRNSLGSFKELVENPERACEVTIQPVDILGVDAAIIFSDILVIPEALGIEYKMAEKVGPIFESPIRTKSDVEKLREVEPEEHLKYVLDAIRLTKKELDGRVPLIGFAGAPWTILSYVTEGKGSKTFSVARKFLYTQPELAHELLSKITRATIAYLKAQIAAGANIAQVFDSWAGILPPDQYRTFAVPYIKQICDAITEVPVIVFARGAWFAFEDLAALDCQVLGVDWNVEPNWARKRANGKTLQGNMDPCMLYASEKEIVAAAHKMLDEFGPTGHIANLGHGVYPDTDYEKVKVFINAVKTYQR